MRVGDLALAGTREGDGLEVSARVGDHRIWFRVPPDHPTPLRADPFLVVGLLAAGVGGNIYFLARAIGDPSFAVGPITTPRGSTRTLIRRRRGRTRSWAGSSRWRWPRRSSPRGGPAWSRS